VFTRRIRSSGRIAMRATVGGETSITWG
jgi:hypothetical protein